MKTLTNNELQAIGLEGAGLIEAVKGILTGVKKAGEYRWEDGDFDYTDYFLYREGSRDMLGYLDYSDTGYTRDYCFTFFKPGVSDSLSLTISQDAEDGSWSVRARLNNTTDTSVNALGEFDRAYIG